MAHGASSSALIQRLRRLFKDASAVPHTWMACAQMPLEVKFTGPLSTVAYRDEAHFDELRTEACAQHVRWLEDPAHSPLNFDMYWAEYELEDFAHGCDWLASSARCFRELLRLPAEDVPDDAGWACANQLHVTMKAALKAVLPAVKRLDGRRKKALDVIVMRETAHLAIDTFFDWWRQSAVVTDSVY